MTQYTTIYGKCGGGKRRVFASFCVINLVQLLPIRPSLPQFQPRRCASGTIEILNHFIYISNALCLLEDEVIDVKLLIVLDYPKFEIIEDRLYT